MQARLYGVPAAAGVDTSPRCPCWFTPTPEEGGQAGSSWGACWGQGLGRRSLGGSAHPRGGAVCRGPGQSPAFAPGSSEKAVGFGAFLYRVVHHLPQLCIFRVIFLLGAFFGAMPAA